MPVEFDFVLASASPRRAELLSSAGFRFTVDPPDVDESLQAGETPETYVLRVARDKARTVAARRRGEVILAADTAVVLGADILGKPVDNADAVRMLTRLSGKVHDVLTAVVMSRSDRELAEVARTRVSFLDLTPQDIAWYVGTGEPHGKAGAYAIQGRGARFADRIEGSWSNVVGLPIAIVSRMVHELWTR
jgi:nucleoside triphosphate pyrophosphatase